MAGVKGLTHRQQAFVREYASRGNVLQAARAAGVKSPESSGYRMMRNAKVQAAIAEVRGGVEAKLAGESAKALAILLNLMENAETDSVRLRAAQEVLDRARGRQGERRDEGDGRQGARTLLDYSDPAAVAARLEELWRRRRDKDDGQTAVRGEAGDGGGGDAER
ncbi:MAG: terminase small subunit [Sporomusaceae bacterium]|nr:terminase small subunit [Sporomusaceae bacterium]